MKTTITFDDCISTRRALLRVYLAVVAKREQLPFTVLYHGLVVAGRKLDNRNLVFTVFQVDGAEEYEGDA